MQCSNCNAMAAQSSQPGGSFDRILRSMQEILPSITADNVTVRYDSSGLGSDETLAGVLPPITVELTGLRCEFLQIGRGACRERGCQVGSNPVVAGSLKNTQKTNKKKRRVI